MSDYSLPRAERIRSLKAIRRLFADGQGGFVYPIRYMVLTQAAQMQSEGQADVDNRGGRASRGVEILFSVPKKFHKRANKRNLLKRRMREAYRLGRVELVERLRESGKSIDIALIYSTKELHSYKTIENAIRKVLGQVAANL